MKSFVSRFDAVWGRHFECLLCGRVFGLSCSESGTIGCPCGAPGDVEEGAILLERLSQIGHGTETFQDGMREALLKKIGEKGARRK